MDPEQIDLRGIRTRLWRVAISIAVGVGVVLGILVALQGLHVVRHLGRDAADLMGVNLYLPIAGVVAISVTTYALLGLRRRDRPLFPPPRARVHRRSDR